MNDTNSRFSFVCVCVIVKKPIGGQSKVRGCKARDVRRRDAHPAERRAGRTRANARVDFPVDVQYLDLKEDVSAAVSGAIPLRTKRTRLQGPVPLWR